MQKVSLLYRFEAGLLPGSRLREVEQDGLRGSQTGELVFDECRVPAAKPCRFKRIKLSGIVIERGLI